MRHNSHSTSWRRPPPPPTSTVSTLSVRLVLVRHGESLWNAAGMFQGHGGVGVSDRGRRQAAVTAGVLAGRFDDVALVARSDLPRVVETAAPAEPRLGARVVVDARLREVDVGRWTGMTYQEVAREDPDAMRAWLRGDDVPRGGGETFADLRKRVWAAVEDLLAAVAAREPATVVVFTHGGPIRVAVAEALGLPTGGERSLGAVANCSLTVLRLDRAGTGQLVAYNQAEHLR
jgi:glucosyl-3-phosphoglycerate phosphatase